jgi:hypothetical protein
LEKSCSKALILAAADAAFTVLNASATDVIEWVDLQEKMGRCVVSYDVFAERKKYYGLGEMNHKTRGKRRWHWRTEDSKKQ